MLTMPDPTFDPCGNRLPGQEADAVISERVAVKVLEIRKHRIIFNT